MIIYAQEKKDDLADLILATPLVSIASIVEPVENKKIFNKNIKALASYNDEDLYYVQSILVTSSWNKNDDIFAKEEVWTAKNTPEDKPTNLEHDEGTIIGHITSNWPITDDGVLIDESTPIENLPDKFHILTGSVIYRSFTSPALKERAENLISEIETGQKYVSMECFFKGFDYGLINKETGEYKVLARNAETAYLTKHLRAYGGLGEYESYKIGRVLRNITFSGKGFVNKPANPDSVIFTQDNFKNMSNEKNNDFQEVSVSNEQSTPNVENTTMSLDLEPVLKEVADIKAKIEAMNCADTIKEVYATVDSLKEKTLDLENTIKANESVISDSNSKLEAFATEKDELLKANEAALAEKDAQLSKLQVELESLNEVLAGYKAKEAEMMKMNKKMKRVADLVEKGIDNTLANDTVDKFETLDDEAFAAITELLVAKMPDWLAKKREEKMKEEMEEESKKKKASEESTVSEEILENVETEEEPALSVGGEDSSDSQSARAALVDFVYNRLGKKLNKGE